MFTQMIQGSTVLHAQSETLLLTSPQGHEVCVAFDYANYTQSEARVINSHTGVVKAIEGDPKSQLAAALRAKFVYDQALKEVRAVEQMVARLCGASVVLDRNHPAVAPYWKEAEQHQQIADAMQARALHFYTAAMQKIDAIADA